MPREVVYSAIYGEYEAPKEQRDLGCPLIMFTDNPDLDAPGWDVRYEPLTNVDGPMMRAKLWKCRPDLAVPEADVSIWIDGSMTVRRPDICAAMHRDLGDREALFLQHPWRDCIYDEARESRHAPKYAGQPMEAQVRYYRNNGHPAHGGLMATGMIVRRNTARVRAIGDRWFYECQRWTFQDQLSLPYVLRSVPVAYGLITDPWGHWWTLGTH